MSLSQVIDGCHDFSRFSCKWDINSRVEFAKHLRKTNLNLNLRIFVSNIREIFRTFPFRFRSFLFSSSTFKNGNVEFRQRFHFRLSTIDETFIVHNRNIYTYIYKAIMNIIVIIVKITRSLKPPYLRNDSGINLFHL